MTESQSNPATAADARDAAESFLPQPVAEALAGLLRQAQREHAPVRPSGDPRPHTAVYGLSGLGRLPGRG